MAINLNFSDFAKEIFNFYHVTYNWRITLQGQLKF